MGEPLPVPAGHFQHRPQRPRSDLVFRVHKLRKAVCKRVGLTLVCPVENGATGHRTDCGRCGVCWK